MQLLIIDDEQSVRESLCSDIGRSGEIQCRDCDFSEAEAEIERSPPDIVVLDLLLQSGPPRHIEPAMKIDDFIWSRHFCPIIVHSAEPDLYQGKHETHPFVKVIQKGRNSLDLVLEALQGFSPHIQALRSAKSNIENSFRTSLSSALRDVAPQVFDDTDDSRVQADTITRAGKRRLVALLEGEPSASPLAPWEIYLCPPISEDTQLGDILMKTSQADEREADGRSNPADFYVVLTPSCDLVFSEPDNRKPNVQKVLVAKCDSMEHRLPNNLKQGRKAKGKIRSQMLTPGHLSGVIPFPKYGKSIPTMAADVRKLKLVPIEKIGEDRAFRRIASIDSPFRELISWAYLQTSCRPGMPDRAFDAWVDEIVEDVERTTQASE